MEYFRGYAIQTFDDRTFCEKDLSLTMCGKPSSYTREKLKKMNERGAGIFFTPNSFPDGVRRKNNCKKINAWFMECDSFSKEEQMNMISYSQLPPSFIVETQKSLHCYWLAKNATIENFEEVQKRLIYNFQADEACKDCSRVLRIPGFEHCKNVERFMVKLIDSHPERIYSEDEMIDKFKIPESSKEERKTQIVIKPSGGGLWDIIGSMPNRDMLLELSGEAIVGGEIFSFSKRGADGSEHILTNGKPCDAWVDSNGMIGSGKGGGPTWVQWLTYYGRNKREIAQWFKEKFGNKDSLGDETMEDISRQLESMGKRQRLTWGVDKLDKEATILEKGQYILVVGETSSGKTPFTLQMAIKNAEIGLNVLYMSLEMPNKALLYRWARNKLGIGFDKVRNNQVPDDKIKEIINSLPKTLSFIKFNLSDIKSMTEKILDGMYDLVVIDNIGYVQADNIHSDIDRDMKVSRAVNSIVRDHGITVVAIQHFRKRGGEKKEMFRSMDSIMGSAKFTHDAHILVQVGRNQSDNVTEEDKAKFEVFVMKDREYDMTGNNTLQYKNGIFF